MLNSFVGIPLEIGSVHGQKFLAMVIVTQVLGQDTLPATVAFSEQTNGSLWQEPSIHPPSFSQELEHFVTSAVLSKCLERSLLISYQYLEATATARAGVDHFLATSNPEYQR